MAISFKTALGNNFNNVSGTTLAVTTTFPIDVGDFVVVRWASDNLSATTPTATCADGGNTYTMQRQGAVGSAGTGIAGGVLTSVATVARPAGSTITLTLSGAVVGKAMYAESFVGVAGTLKGAQAQTGTTSAITTPSNVTVATGDLVISAVAQETRSAMTGDSTSSNGTWSTLTFVRGGGTGGSDATSVTAAGQYMVITGSVTFETWNMTGVAAEYWAGLLVFAPIPEATVTQAAYRFYADGTETGSTALAAQDTAATADISGGDANLAVRVRMQSTNTGFLPPTDDYQLQYEKNTSGTWLDVAAAGTESLYNTFVADNSSNFSLTTTITFLTMSFYGDGNRLTKAGFRMQNSSGSGTLTFVLFEASGSAPATSVPVASSIATLTTAQLGAISEWRELAFDGTYTLVNGTRYLIGVSYAGTGSVTVGGQVTGTPPAPGDMYTWNGTVWSFNSLNPGYRVYTAPAGTTVVPYASANLTDGAATTNRLGAGSGSFVAGEVSETGLVTDFGLSVNDHTELLYPITLKAADLANADVLNFRVLRNGATTGLTYTQTPTITIGPSEGTLDQRRYRVYADGTESGSTALAAENTAPTIDVTSDVTCHLRIQYQETAALNISNAYTWQLQYDKNSAGTWIDVTSSSAAVRPFVSANIVEDQATTPRLTSGTGTWWQGKCTEFDAWVSHNIIASGYTEVLWSLTLRSAGLVNGDSLRFRITVNGVTTYLTYAVYPTINVTAAVVNAGIETGAGADDASVATDQVAGETAAGTDDASVTLPPADQADVDAASGTDAASMSAQADATEAGAGADDASFQGQAAGSEVAVGADDASLLQQLTDADAGTGVDDATVAVLQSGAETAAATDDATSISTLTTATEQATGTDDAAATNYLNTGGAGFSDTFDRADTTPVAVAGVGLGASWAGDGAHIEGNRAVRGSGNLVSVWQTPVPGDQAGEIDLESEHNFLGVVLRKTTASGSSYDSCYIGMHDGNAGQIWIMKYTGGSFDGFVASPAYTGVASPVTLRFEAQGSNLRLYINGVLKASATDSAHTGSYIGINWDGADDYVLAWRGGALGGGSSIEDTAAGADNATSSVDQQGAETGSGTDNLSWTSVAAVDAETGTGSDDATLSLLLSDGETGAGADDATVDVGTLQQSGSETGSGTDDATLTVTNSGSESATGTDTGAATNIVTGPPGFTPDDLTGLGGWYDASQLALADGAPVTVWTDLSGAGRNLTLILTGSVPSLKTNELNGLPVVRFDGVDNVLTASLAANYRHFFIVAKYNLTTFANYDGLLTGTSGYVFIGQDGATNWYTFDPADAVYRVNGVVDATRQAPMAIWAQLGIEAPGATSWSGFTVSVGLDRGFPPRYWDGDIAEIIAYDHVLSDAERIQVEGYLQAKWFGAGAGGGIEEAGTATDSASVVADTQVSGTDAANGVDDASIVISVVPQGDDDTAVGTDVASITATTAVDSDFATSVDNASITSVSVDATADTGAASDAAFLVESRADVVENASGLDDAQLLQVILSDTDSGFGSDNVTVDTGGLDGFEFGAGAEDAAVQAAASDAQAGTGSDSALVTVDQTSGETATGSDIATLTVEVQDSDTGSGLDALTTTSTDAVDFDSASSVDDAFLALIGTLGAETGTSVDDAQASELGQSPEVAETALGTDLASMVDIGEDHYSGDPLYPPRKPPRRIEYRPRRDPAEDELELIMLGVL